MILRLGFPFLATPPFSSLCVFSKSLLNSFRLGEGGRSKILCLIRVWWLWRGFHTYLSLSLTTNRWCHARFSSSGKFTHSFRFLTALEPHTHGQPLACLSTFKLVGGNFDLKLQGLVWFPGNSYTFAAHLKCSCGLFEYVVWACSCVRLYLFCKVTLAQFL